MSTPQALRPSAATDASTAGDAIITITVYGDPAPQGSKQPLGTRLNKAGKQVGAFKEDSAKLKPWRAAVANAGTVAKFSLPPAARLRFPLDGPLAAAMFYTLGPKPASRPTWWPKGQPWSKTMHWRPAGPPDLSKLLRAAEDALTGVLWHDDARVVEYRGLAKYYIGDPFEDTLDRAGAVIRIWQIGGTP